MDMDRVDVSALNDEQICSLLAFGSTSFEPESAPREAMNILQQAVDDPSGQQLQLLISDLKCMVLSGDHGPLSFRRVTGLTEDEAQEFEGQTFAALLTSPTTSRATLERFADYGGILVAEIFPRSTKLAGAVIRTLALAALAGRHSAAVSEINAQEDAALLAALSMTKDMPGLLREDARQFRQRRRKN